MNKQQQIEEILQSAKAIRPVSGNPYLHTRIEEKLREQPVQKISLRWVYAFSAVLLLLLLANVTVWRTSSAIRNSVPDTAATEEFSLTGNNRYALNY